MQLFHPRTLSCCSDVGFDPGVDPGVDPGCAPPTFVSSGVRVLTAPVNLCVWFKPPVALKRRLTIEFWEACDGVSFRVHHPGGQVPHLSGLICRS